LEVILVLLTKEQRGIKKMGMRKKKKKRTEICAGMKE